MTRVRSDGARRAAPDVVVVGAGVVGAATALGLAQAGLRVAVVEARVSEAWDAQAPRDLRVFAIAPASIGLFRRLGVWDAISSRRAQPYREMRVWDAGAAGELHFRAFEAGAEALGRIIEQAAIQDALWRALRAHERIALHAPASIVGIEREPAAVVLELDNGQRLQAALAIAADGAESPLRRFAGIDVDARPYGQRGVVAYVETGSPHADTAWQRFLPSGPLALLPCADGLGSIVWTLPETGAERLLHADDAVFDEELTRAFEARLGAMRVVSKRAAFPLRMQLARRYVADRVVLVGDAAHVVHPLAGQGVNLGLQDAHELIEALARARDAGRDLGDTPTLRRYERSRRSENALAARTFDGLNRLFSNDALLPTVLRGPALGLVDRLSPLKRLLARHAMGTAAR